jgi:hypothetical protein
MKSGIQLCNSLNNFLIEPQAELAYLELIIMSYFLIPIPPLVFNLEFLDPLVQFGDIIFEPQTLKFNQIQPPHSFPNAGLLAHAEMTVFLP